jgi:hypothetical protein
MQKAKIDDEHIGGADQSKAKIGYEHVHFGPDHIESADTIKNLIQTWFLLMPFRGAYSFAFSLSHTLERPPPAHPAQSVRAPHTQIQNLVPYAGKRTQANYWNTQPNLWI